MRTSQQSSVLISLGLLSSPWGPFPARFNTGKLFTPTLPKESSFCPLPSPRVRIMPVGLDSFFLPYYLKNLPSDAFFLIHLAPTNAMYTSRIPREILTATLFLIITIPYIPYLTLPLWTLMTTHLCRFVRHVMTSRCINFHNRVQRFLLRRCQCSIAGVYSIWDTRFPAVFIVHPRRCATVRSLSKFRENRPHRKPCLAAALQRYEFSRYCPRRIDLRRFPGSVSDVKAAGRFFEVYAHRAFCQRCLFIGHLVSRLRTRTCERLCRDQRATILSILMS